MTEQHRRTDRWRRDRRDWQLVLKIREIKVRRKKKCLESCYKSFILARKFILTQTVDIFRREFVSKIKFILTKTREKIPQRYIYPLPKKYA